MSLSKMQTAALWLIGLLVAAATCAAFAESYRALYEWALTHGIPLGWARAWPLQVDTFIAVGELALFVALVRTWTPRDRAAAWAVTLIGVGVSVAGNVGHVLTHDWASRMTAAIPPLAAAAALAVGLGVLKRVVATGREPDRAKPAPSSEPVAKKAATRPPGGRSRAKSTTAGRSDTLAAQRAAQERIAAALPDFTGKELAPILGVAERTARRRIEASRALADPYAAEPLIGDDELQDADRAALAGHLARYPANGSSR